MLDINGVVVVVDCCRLVGYVMMRAFLSTSQVKSNQSDLAKKTSDRTTPRDTHTHSQRAELISSLSTNGTVIVSNSDDFLKSAAKIQNQKKPTATSHAIWIC
jgi:hypothetical protein